MPLSGHFMGIEVRALVHQTEKHQLSLTYDASWLQRAVLLLIFYTTFTRTKSSDDTFLPFADFLH